MHFFVYGVAATCALFGLASGEGYQGCFKSSSNWNRTSAGSSTFNSQGTCRDACSKKNMAIAAPQNKNCFCSNEIPPDKTDDSNCGGCPGYPPDKCGKGTDYFAIYLSGVGNVESVSSGSSSSPTTSSSTSSATKSSTSISPASKTSAKVEHGQTIYVVQTAGVTSSPKKSGGGTNKGAIAGGVVGGVVALAGLSALALFFVRRKRQQEDPLPPPTAVAGGEPKYSENPFSDMADSRLDPSITSQRRMSNGSIADDQDFSRRILKVTNPDAGNY